MDATLLIMAAGIGSRFGGGIKQLATLGPNGEIIMDFSIYDALEAGFNKVVFIIRHEIEKDFKEIIGNRISQKVKVEYAFQETSYIPEKYKEKFKNRTKPFGTGHAVLCAADKINEPFAVINADDYYGKEFFKKAYSYLTTFNEYGLQGEEKGNKFKNIMAGYRLKNTLSANGTVTRGLCQVGENSLLTDIVETYDLIKDGDEVKGVEKYSDGISKEIITQLDTPTSMNLWGLYPNLFKTLEKGFEEFLESIPEGDSKSEYLLPCVIGDEIKAGRMEVEVIDTKDSWFGVTYSEDAPIVKKNIEELINAG